MEPLDDLSNKEIYDLFEAARLAARYKEGLLSGKEWEALQQWMEASPRHRDWFESLLNSEDDFAPKLDTFKELTASGDEAFRDVCARVGIEPLRPAISRRRRIAGVAAAAVLLIAGAALFHYVHSDNHNLVPQVAMVNDVPPGQSKATLSFDGGTVDLDSAHEGIIAQPSAGATIRNGNGELSYAAGNGHTGALHYNTVTTNKGQYKLLLSDGTKVWLDAKSSLKFPTVFASNRREVEVTGQVYMEVAHHKAPFIVHTSKGDIQDLGTAFNINTYPDESSAQFTLVEGSIRVVPSTGAAGRVLTPGQQALISSTDGLKVHSDVDLDEVTGWTKGMFVFDHADLKTILRQVSRWYGVEVVYADDIPAKSIKGMAPRDVNLSVLIAGLSSMMTDVHFSLNGNKLIVSR
jgi:ferric-dicitrate binding protein FerR (iron transport regulator)